MTRRQFIKLGTASLLCALVLGLDEEPPWPLERNDMPRYNFMLAEALHKRFKVACIVAGLPMSPMLACLISQWLSHPIPPPDMTDEDEAAAKLQDVLLKASARR